MQTRLMQFGWMIALGMVVEVAAMPVGAQEMTNEPSPSTTVELDQGTSLVQVQEVRLEPTETGVEIILVTAGGAIASPNFQTVGNALIIDIPNALLVLPGEQGFEQVSLTADIAFVSVTQMADNQVRLAITGVDGPPEAEVKSSPQGLQLVVRPGIAQTAATVDEVEALQIVVSATRTEEEIANIPRSVTVIQRAEIEQQTQVYSSLADILGQLVPGLAPSTGSASQFGQPLRGRNVLVLIDGVPQTTNSNLWGWCHWRGNQYHYPWPCP
ncbi:AMIN domain-containing protein [Synechocystis sp. PCC 7339]|uniref:AMIN domain-containing protein n=1 Tax=Synechocystis sp. PCC 7339 TaxID=2782213 RepID=UPI001CBB8D80|nr:AMIN domain-containing protein [Synechocystis sp. PCC 7339]